MLHAHEDPNDRFLVDLGWLDLRRMVDHLNSNSYVRASSLFQQVLDNLDPIPLGELLD